MKKILLLPISFLLLTSMYAQENPGTSKKKKTVNLSGRANDHFVIQYGFAGWAGRPDTVHVGGFSKSFNVYFMFDFPFKTNPKLSMAFGPGISSDHIKFKQTYVGIKDPTTTLNFTDQSDTTHFKRTTLATAYLEAPVEFRYSSDPMNSARGLKLAIGVKVGTMINAHTRNKDLQSSTGGALNSYSMKESSKRFFNTTRLSAQARVGWGHLSLYGSYQLTPLFKDGVAAPIRPYAIGLTLSGL